MLTHDRTAKARNTWILKLALCAIMIAGAAGGWGQSFMPENSGSYLAVTGSTAYGSLDNFNVVFFSVPDTVSSMLYFTVEDPANDGTPPDAAATGTTTYYLAGGSGCYSTASARYRSYASYTDALAGATELASQSYTTTTQPLGNVFFFPGVSPSQGEHIGNRYYFKVIAQADTNVGKNAFRLGISLASSGTPTGVSGARAFSYSLCLELFNSAVFDLYPFVNDSVPAADYIVFSNFDVDTGNATGSGTTTAAWNSVPSAITAPSLSATDNTYNDTSYLLGTNTGATWRQQITSQSSATSTNPAEFWYWYSSSSVSGANQSGTPPTVDAYLLPIYSAYYSYTSSNIDHVALSPASSYVYASGNASTAIQTISAQIVDSSGNALPFVRKIGVTVDGTASINGLASPQVVTTDGSGVATFTVSTASTSDQDIHVLLSTDGTNGSDAFGSGTDGDAYVYFRAAPPPTISSASNTSVSQGSGATLADITITATSGSSIPAGGSVVISYTGTGSIAFSTTAPTYSGTGSARVSAIAATASAITVTIGATGLTSGQTLILSGAAITSSNSIGTGRLRVTTNGGTSYASDDKSIIVSDPNTTYVWNGTGTDWNTPSCWSPSSVPATSGDNAYIPAGYSNYPTLSAAVSINNLTIESGATATLGNYSLTIGGAISNAGTIIINGTGRPSKNDTTKGTVRYTGSSQAITDFGTTDYYDLSLAGTSYSTSSAIAVAHNLSQSAGALSLGGAVGVAGSYTISGGSLSQATYDLTVSTSFTASGAPTFSSGTGRIVMDGTGTISTAGLSLVNLTVASSGIVTNGATLNLTGNLVVAGGLSAGATAINVAGNVDFTGGSFTAGTSTLTMNSSGTARSLTTNAVSFNNLQVTTGTDTVTVTGALNVGATLTIAANNTLDLGTNDFAIATLSNAGVFRLAGNTAATHSITTPNPSAGSFEYSGSGACSIYDFGATDYYDLLVSGSGTFTLSSAIVAASTVTVNSSASLALAGNSLSAASVARPAGAGTGSFLSAASASVVNAQTVTIAGGSGTIDLSAITFNLSGETDWSDSGFTGTWTAMTSGQLNLNGTTTPSISSGHTLYDITIADGVQATCATPLSARNLAIGTSAATAQLTKSGANALALTGSLSGTGRLVGPTITGSISIGGGWSVALYTNNGATIAFNGSAASVTLQSNSQTLGPITLSKSAQANTVVLSGDLISAGQINLSTGTLDAAANSAAIQATGFVSAGGASSSFSPGTQTVTLTGGDYVACTQFYNLAVGTGLVTLSGATTASNALTVSGAGRLALAGNTLGAATITMSGSAVFFSSASAAAVSAQSVTITGSSGTFDGNNISFALTGETDWSDSGFTGTWTAMTSGQLNLNGTTTPSISSGHALYDIAIADGVQATCATPLSARNLAIGTSAATAQLTKSGANALALTGSLSGTGRLVGPTSTGSISIGGGWSVALYTDNGATITFNGATTPAVLASNGQVLGPVTINKSAAAGVVQLSGNLSCGQVALTQGVLDAATNSANIGAAGFVDAGTNGLSAAGRTVTITGGNLSGTHFPNLVITGTTAATGAVTASGSFTLTSGGISAAASRTITASGVTLTSGAFDGTNLAFVVNGAGGWTDTSFSGTWTASPASLQMLGTSSLSSAQTLVNLTIGDGSTATATTLGHDLALSGTLSITAGASLDASAGNRAISTVSWTRTGSGVFTAGTGTVTFTGSGSISGTMTGTVSSSFYNLVFNGATTANASLDTAQDLSIGAAHSLAAAAGITITVGGNWSNGTSGVFTPSTSTVSFTAGTTGVVAHTISGSSSFYNLSYNASAGSSGSNTLYLADGSTQTIVNNGTLTLRGASGNLLAVTRSGTSSTWIIDMQSSAAQAVYFVDLSYGNASTRSITAYTSHDGGNNDSDTYRWVFDPTPINWTGGASTSVWDTGANWQYGYVPNATDSVTIPTGLTYWPNINGLSKTLVGFTLNGTLNATGSGSITLTGNLIIGSAASVGNPANTNWILTSAGATISSGVAATIGNVTASSSGIVSLLTYPLTVSSLVVTSGSFSAGGLALTVSGAVSGAGTLVASSATTTIGGNVTVASLTPNGGILLLNGGAAQALSAYSLSSLTIDNSSGVNAGATDIAGTLTLTSGTLAMGANSLTMSGATSSIVKSAPGGTLSSTGTIYFTGTGNQTADLGSASSLGSATIQASKTGGSLRFSTGFTVGSFTVGSSKNFAISFNTGAGQSTTITNSVTFDNIGALVLGDDSGDAMIFDGGVLSASAVSSLQLAGSITTSDDALNLNHAASLAATTVLGTGGTTGSLTLGGVITGGGNALTINACSASSGSGGNMNGLGNFTLASSAAFTPGGSVAVGGNLSLSSGTLTMNANGLTVAGNITRGSGSVAFTTTGTLTLNGSAAQDADFTASTLRNLTVTNSAAAVRLIASGGTTVGGALTVTTSGATLNSNGYDLSVNGAADFTGATLSAGSGGTLSFGGNLSLGALTNYAGTTFRFNGSSAQAIVPNGQTFNAVQMTGSGGVSMAGTAIFATLDIGTGETFTLGGAAATSLTLSGASGTVLQTGATSGGLRWDATSASVLVALSGATNPVINNQNSSGLRVISSANGATLNSTASVATLNGPQLSLNGNNLRLGNISTATAHAIGSGESITLINPVTFSGGLSLSGNAATAVDLNGQSLTVGNTAGLTINTGTVTVRAGSTLLCGSSDIIINGGATLGGTLSFTGAPAANTTCRDLIVNSGTVSGSIANGAANTIDVSRNVAVNGGFTNPGNSIIRMGGGVAETIDTGTQIGSLTLQTSSTAVTVSAHALNLYGDLSVGNGTSLTDAPNDLGMSVGGNAVITSSGSVTSGDAAAGVTGATSGSGAWYGNAGALTFSGDFSLASIREATSTTTFGGAAVTFSAFAKNGSAGTLRLNRASGQSLTTNAQHFNHVSLVYNTAGKTVAVTNALYVDGNLEVGQAQVLDLATNGAALAVGGTTNAIAGSTYGRIDQGGTATFSGDFRINAYVASAANINFDGSCSSVAIGSGAFACGTGAAAFSRAGSTTLTSNGAWYALSVANGTTVIPQNDTTVNQNFALANGGIWTPGSHTVYFATATAGAISDSNGTLVNLGAVAVSGTNKSAGSSLSMATLGVTGALTIGNAYTLNVSSSTSVTGGSLTLNGAYAGGSATFDVGTNPGTVNVAALGFSAGTMTVSTGGSFTQTGANGAGTQSIASLTVSGGTCSWDSVDDGGYLALAGAMTVSGGTLNLHTKNVSGIGVLGMTGGTLNLNGATIGASRVSVTGGNLLMGNSSMTLSSAPNIIRSVASITDASSSITLGSSGGTLSLDDSYSIGNLNVNIGTTLIAGGRVKNVTIAAGVTLALSGASSAVDLSVLAGDTLDASAVGALLQVADSSNPVTLSSQTSGSAFTYTGNDIGYNYRALTIRDMNAPSLASTIDSASVTLNGAAGQAVAFSSLALTGSATLYLGAGSLTCGSLSSGLSSSIDNTGINTVTVSGNVSIGGSFGGTLTYSSIDMTGTGILSASPTIGHLIVTGATTLGAPLVLAGNLTIAAAGLLDVDNTSSYSIGLAGNWINNRGVGGFACRQGTVTLNHNSGTVDVQGSTTFYRFYCDTTGSSPLTIRFSNGDTFAFVNTIDIQSPSATNRITLTRQTAGADPDYTTSPNGQSWNIDIQPSVVTFEMTNVDVYYSNAYLHPVLTPDNVNADLNAPYWDFKWLGATTLAYSFTEDSDGNGKIDRIRVQANAALDGNFSGFTANVAGYTVTGYTLYGADPYMFYINLKEQPYNDTGVKPTWTILNTSLRNSLGTKHVLAKVISSPMVPTNTAFPKLTYTLALPNSSQVFVHASEALFGGSLAFSTSGTPALSSFSSVTSSGGGTSEFLLNLASAVDTLTIAGGSASISISGAQGGDVPAVDQSLTSSILPSPKYPTAIYSYASYDFASGAGIAPPYNLLGSPATHRVSDLLVSLPPPPSGTYDPATYFTWPIYAKDNLKLSLSDDQIAALTAAQSAAQGIGLIRAFDGSQWLRPQDILLQTKVSSALGLSYQPTLVYDTNVASSYVNSTSGTWLPTHLETAFSGLDGYPDSNVNALGSPTLVSAGNLLWNFTVPSTDSKVSGAANDSVFGFFYRLAGVPTDLYVARLAISDPASIPSNWYRYVRPFSFYFHKIIQQKGGVTILNNVIDPTKGETARLDYQLATAGAVTVTVFTLDGDVVARLVNASSQAAGDYAVYWNGKNLGGNPVARGLYFVRLVAPGMDEIRKVIVVRK